MTDRTTPLFNKSQQNALAAIGLPLWRERSINVDVPPRQNEHCYRLSSWLIVTDSPLPVNRPQWLNDLVHTLDQENSGALAETAASTIENWPKERIIYLALEPGNVFPAAAKRETWNQIVSRSL
ncbi:hypothetical protein [Pseudidiomarina gelatinasegens]|jgi:hypothetical protein|uniref:hypothetical protein n=1 Tax=Pseudidiomarina gelatinasegens TaxID=2487740 RepID=UPI003A97A24B